MTERTSTENPSFAPACYRPKAKRSYCFTKSLKSPRAASSRGNYAPPCTNVGITQSSITSTRQRTNGDGRQGSQGNLGRRPHAPAKHSKAHPGGLSTGVRGRGRTHVWPLCALRALFRGHMRLKAGLCEFYSGGYHCSSHREFRSKTQKGKPPKAGSSHIPRRGLQLHIWRPTGDVGCGYREAQPGPRPIKIADPPTEPRSAPSAALASLHQNSFSVLPRLGPLFVLLSGIAVIIFVFVLVLLRLAGVHSRTHVCAQLRGGHCFGRVDEMYLLMRGNFPKRDLLSQLPFCSISSGLVPVLPVPPHN